MSPEPPSVRFPLEGTWLVLNPPGHPRHAYDISALGPERRLLRVPWWKVALGRAHARDLYGWGRPISSPVGGEVVTAVDGIPDRDRLNPIGTCRPRCSSGLPARRGTWLRSRAIT